LISYFSPITKNESNVVKEEHLKTSRLKRGQTFIKHLKRLHSNDYCLKIKQNYTEIQQQSGNGTNLLDRISTYLLTDMHIN